MKLERFRNLIGLKLHSLAGRIHPDYDFRSLGFTATLEPGQGITIGKRSDMGLPLWYRHPEHHRIHPDTYGQPITLDDLYTAKDSPYAELFNDLGVVYPGTGKAIPRENASQDVYDKYDLPEVTVARGGMTFTTPRSNFNFTTPPTHATASEDGVTQQHPLSFNGYVSIAEREYEPGSDLFVSHYPDGSLQVRYGAHPDTDAIRRLHHEYATTTRDHVYDGSTGILTVEAPAPPPDGPTDPYLSFLSDR